MGHKKAEKKKKKTGVQLHQGVLEVTRSGMGFVIAKGPGTGYTGSSE